MKMRRIFILLIAAVMMLSCGAVSAGAEDVVVEMYIDGNKIEEQEGAFLKNGRVMVPVRLLAEELGAEVLWEKEQASVLIRRDAKEVCLFLNRRFVRYTMDGADSWDLSDASPQALGGRTYVPLKIVSRALDVKVKWDPARKAVSIDSGQKGDQPAPSPVVVSSPLQGAVISGTTMLQSKVSQTLVKSAGQIRYFLLDPKNGTGFVIAKGSDPNGVYTWLPKRSDTGQKVLAAVICDKKGNYLSGTAQGVRMEVDPKVVLAGAKERQKVSGSMELRSSSNHSAAYIIYTFVNEETGKTAESSAQDPQGKYVWTPSASFNGTVKIRAVAYDEKKQSKESDPVSVAVQVSPKLELKGLTAGQTVKGPVTLSSARNFDVVSTEYIMKDMASGKETSLLKTGYGNFNWFPGPDAKGKKEVFVRVKSVDGKEYKSTGIRVTVEGTPRLLLSGTGPGQVITQKVPAKLKVSTNVPLAGIKYILTNSSTGKKKTLEGPADPLAELAYSPAPGEKGTYKIKAVGMYGTKQSLVSEEVKVTLYDGIIYPPKAIVEKSGFQDLASRLSLADSRKSGMSAALQAAQAILESGWGQSVPVDKYNGKLSYNLFGIKGSASAGSVVSNTWEEYNGAVYRIDAKFRAYRSIEESWADHNKLLLNASRYAPFRKVMYDGTLGAWELKRCGYATDSKYPVKLIDLMETYGLRELDRVSL